MNPAAIMKLMGAKNKFEHTHPKFVAFFKAVIRQGIKEGSVIEITVTDPDGTTMTGNMRVQETDLQLMNDLKNMMSNQ